MESPKCISRTSIHDILLFDWTSTFVHVHTYTCSCAHISIYMCRQFAEDITVRKNHLPTLSFASKGAKDKLNKENWLKEKEKDSRLEELIGTQVQTVLGNVGNLVTEQTLGNRFNYCISILLTEVLSLGLISRTHA